MNKIIFTLMAAVLCSLLTAQTIVEKHGLLKVKDAHVVDRDARFISLCGNSLFWSTNGWGGDKFYNAGVVKFLKDDWNSSIVRIAMGAEGAGNYSADPAGQTAKVKTVVDACIAEGVYVIIDFHAHNAHNYKSQAITFFKEMATAYSEYDNVIYEIFNEPISVSWSNVVKPYSEEVIAAIREIDPDNLIIVGTPYYSQRVVEASLDPIDDVNVAYTLHFYADTHKQELRSAATEAMNNGIAIFITEWGTCNSSGNTGHNEGSSDEWMNFCKENFISVCNWAINDKKETASSLVEGASTTGGWTDEDYTPSGRYVRNLMLNWDKPCESVSLPNTIEAENYCTLAGVQKQACSEGGRHLGEINDGDWMSYQVTVEKTGIYTVSYRIASPDGGGKIQLNLSDSVLPEPLDLPKTEDWQDWTTVSQDVMLLAGTYDLRLLALAGGFNINWIKIMPKTEEAPVLTTVTLYPADTTMYIGTSIRFSAQGFDQNGNPYPINPVWGITGDKPGATIDPNGLFTASEAIDTYTVTFALDGSIRSVEVEVVDPCPAKVISDGRIEAEDYCDFLDVQVGETTDEGGGLNVGYINAGSRLTYTIDVPVAGNYRIDFRVSNGSRANGQMKIFVNDTELIKQQTIPRIKTNDWETYQTISTIPFELQAGKHELKFNISAGGFNINWFEFKNNVTQSVSLNTGNLSDIYPNPVRRGDLLHVSSSSGINRVRLNDLRGVAVYTQSVDGIVNELAIPTEGLSKGVYLLQLTTEQSQEGYKVIVE
ncbi:MAG: cellulase family glycosylhydrolase [Prevotellaceae bacterium]|jgi:endoglucanase|nr:cellulase family glycosylhydrolase [Prevotellaceae bacterium]